MANEKQRIEIKAAFRDLVKEAGGQERAALLTGMPQPKISEAGSLNHPDRAPRVDHIAILEADTGRPHITKLLAEYSGHRLEKVGKHKPADPHVHLAHIIKESGDVAALISQALADGTITATEAKGLKVQADEAIIELQKFAAQMADIMRGDQ
jgi:hypothetical protein